MSYTKLSHSILTSTLWMEDAHTRLVWVTMLAMKDRHGEVMGSIPGLANVARVPVEACRAAIAKFLAPDPDSRTTDHEGRRIEAITGGWLILNHAAYRDMDSDDDRRRKAAIRQQRARDRKKEASRRDGVTNHTNLAMQISDADSDSEVVACREETALCSQEDMEKAKAIMAEDAKPKPPLPMPPKSFRDFRAVHGRIHVGRDEREDWEALFKAYQWDAMHDMHESIKDERIFLNTATRWLTQNYEV